MAQSISTYWHNVMLIDGRIVRIAAPTYAEAIAICIINQHGLPVMPTKFCWFKYRHIANQTNK